jgi:predicted alpha-1,2-mannosidase
MAHAANDDPANWANPMVGTDAHGHSYPGATVPFGMVQLSPDTHTDDWDGCSGYHYRDDVIQGFTHTHLSGTGCGGLGDLLLMPTVGDVHFDLGTPGNGYISRFSHSQELAKPGYYRVFLQTPKVTAELTATERCGFHRYTFPASDSSHIIVDLLHGVQNDAYDTELKVENSTTISGYRFSNGWGGRRAFFFVMQLSRPFDSIKIERDGQPLPAGTTDARGMIKAALNYATSADEKIEVKVGISGTSIEGARKNLAAEIPAWNFAKVRSDAWARWNKELGVVSFDSTNPHDKRTFYTNLYQSQLGPVMFNDVDGSYMGMDHKVHRQAGFTNYTTFSLWDTYRAQQPLVTIVHPARVSDMVRSLLQEFKETGGKTTPIWPFWGNETYCMIGYHSVPVIVDAYFKGFKGFDPETAYQAMRTTATADRDGLDTYKTIGYVASRPGMCATSKTLEYAFDDWCLAKMAQSLGHESDAQMFFKRAGNYRNVFDRTSMFMRGRKADGSWRSPFDRIGMVGDEYTEADCWQYAFCVQHDIPGLIKTYGGDAVFTKKLDAMFAADSTIHTSIPDISGLIGQFSQGDEQCHHVSYLYDFAGQPWKTQQRVRQVMHEMYNDTPAGQCGNVDVGQMSAWYVLSAMGFYPVNPASSVYEIGSPTASKAVIHLDPKFYKGGTFTILAENNDAKNVYIQSATLNGKPFNRTWITHKEITSGGVLKLVMGPRPNKHWGSSVSARPASGMPTNFQYVALAAPAGPDPDPTIPAHMAIPVRVVCGSDEAVGPFEPDPNMMDGQTNHGDVDIDTSAPNSAPAAVYDGERYAKDFTYRFAVPTDGAYTIRLHFAEIFDSGAGMRKENISINGNRVLSDFDIFASAGGTNKAVVKEFSGIKPDAKGVISIRIQAAPDSPDQNAKISALEILPASESTASGQR